MAQQRLPAVGKAIDEELADLYHRTCEATDALHARAAELLEMTGRLEELTEGNDGARYASTRAALGQAEEPRWGFCSRLFGG